MDVSFNIILDHLSHYNCDLINDSSANSLFQRCAFLPEDMSQLKSNYLYVCYLSEAVHAAVEHPELTFICLGDASTDALENVPEMSGVIVKENLVLEALFSEVQDIFVIIHNWYGEIYEAALKKKSIQDILTLSEPILGNFISISDSALALLAYTKNISTDDPISLFLIENKYHSDEAIDLFKRLGRFEVWTSCSEDQLLLSTNGEVSKYDIVNKVFSYENKYYTHVVMFCNHRKLTQGLLDIYEHFVHVLKYIIIDNWEKEKNNGLQYHSFFNDLIERRLTTRKIVINRARQLGITPDDQFVILLLSEDNAGISPFPDLIAQNVRQILPFVRPVIINMHLLLFIHHSDLQYLPTDQNVKPAFEKFLKENNLRCGISEVFDDLLHFRDAFLQAELALNIATGNYFVGIKNEINEILPNERNNERVAHFNRHFAAFIVDRSAECQRLWQTSRFGKILLDIKEHDMEKQTNNFDILYAYLFCERRPIEAASILHMHRNNVVYRISKIEKMYDLDLNDEVTRLNLFLSFLMYKTM